MNSVNQSFVDTKQSWWALTVIQMTGWTSLPILATSILVLQENSFLGAALTIVVGNAILWFIRLGIIAMSYEKRQSTLDLAKEYLGRVGGYFIAALLLISTFAWFIVQTSAASGCLTHLISIREDPNIDQFIQVSVLVGLASTLLCMEGVVLLRRLSMVAFPILLVALLVVLFSIPDHGAYQNSNPLSLAGLSLVLATNLGITADMPTFFRHSESWLASIKALTVTQVISLVLGLVGLYLGSVINGWFEVNEGLILQSGNDILRVALIVFVFVSAVCTNVANVYSASVGWEVIAPKALIGRQEYLILGLSLTTLFILLSNVSSPIFLLSISDCALVNLSLVLMVAYILKRYQKGESHQSTYFLAWGLATMLNIGQVAYSSFLPISPLLVSVVATGLVVLASAMFLRK